ncbi:hypothetical protein, partial [Nocardia abscessus]|uniref:hypothetical protein n=1 Tax=Nocardia abscessus TaxID=120957 RepID=UPI003CC7E7AD
MPQYDAGTAAIRVKPNLSGFATEVETRLRQMDFGVDVNLGIDTRVAAAEMEVFRRAAADNVTFRVDADTRVAAAEIEGLRAAARERVTMQVDVDSASTARARAGMARVTSSLRDAARINISVIGVIGAAGALAELAALANAAAKVTQSLAIAPAVGFAGLAGIGAAATGLSGIPAAFKAAGAASRDASTAAAKQRDELDRVTDAQFRAQQADRSHVDSLRDLYTAYRDAGRSIRDMNTDLDAQKLSTEDAALSVQEAARRLAEVQNDPRADFTARARADLSYRQAINRLTQQQNKTQDLAADTAAANAAGVDGSEQVTTAKQRVADATHAQAQAERDLVRARDEAAKPSGAQGKLDEAMAKLSPNARQLVTDVREIGPAWRDARLASQDALTNGMGPAITTLADRQLPNLRAGMVGIDSAINTGIRASIAALSSDTNRVDFKTSLDNTTAGFRNAARGSDVWTNALTKLITVGSDFLPKLGDAITHTGERFNNLIQRTAADGSLKKWMQDGVDTGKELASIAGNVGSSIRSVFKAAGDDGETLRKLDALTERMSKFLKSTEGQEKLREFFREGRESFERMLPILADLPGILKSVFDGFQAWGGVMVPILRTAADLMQAHPGLVRDIVVAWLAFKTVGPIIDGVRAGMASLNTSVASFRAGLAAETGAASSSLGRLGTLLGATGPLGAVALAVGIGAGLTYLANKHAEAARAAEEQRQKVEQLRATLDKSTGAVTQETLGALATELADQGFTRRAQSLGVDPNAFLRASAGLADADRSAIEQQLTRTIVEQKGSAGGTWNAARATGLSDADIALALSGNADAVKRYEDALTRAQAALTKTGSREVLPDLSKLKDSLNDIGESAATLAGRMNGVGVDIGSAQAKIRDYNATVNGTFALTNEARQRFEGMGLAIQQVPDSKTIVIKDTTPENIQRIKDLKYEVHNNLDGTLTIVADTERARADIAQVTTAPYTAKVDVKFAFDEAQLNVEARRALNPGSGDLTTVTGGHVGGRASGGRLPRTGPGTARTPGSLGMHTATGFVGAVVGIVVLAGGCTRAVDGHAVSIYDDPFKVAGLPTTSGPSG